jgi:hypothetical protein
MLSQPGRLANQPLEGGEEEKGLLQIVERNYAIRGVLKDEKGYCQPANLVPKTIGELAVCFGKKDALARR